MKCFVCNVRVELAPDARVGFRDCCVHCGADLHICRNCRFYDPAAYNECRESSAERVADAESSNRCDWFEASQLGGAGDKRTSALADLDALFKK
ncbi:MAG: hypothetical protein QMC73_13705 [Myxococcota bacterium]|jgi:hypothetical protein